MEAVTQTWPMSKLHRIQQQRKHSSPRSQQHPEQETTFLRPMDQTFVPMSREVQSSPPWLKEMNVPAPLPENFSFLSLSEQQTPKAKVGWGRDTWGGSPPQGCNHRSALSLHGYRPQHPLPHSHPELSWVLPWQRRRQGRESTWRLLLCAWLSSSHQHSSSQLCQPQAQPISFLQLGAFGTPSCLASLNSSST